MIKHRFVQLSMGAILLATLTTASQGTIVPITNPSFEDPATATVDSTAAIPGWVKSGYAPGVWNINAYPAGFWNSGVTAPDGNQVAYMPSAGSDPGAQAPASLSQTLSATLQANTLYSLSGWVGAPIGYSYSNPSRPITQYNVQLFAGTHLLSSILAVPIEGIFTPFTLTYESGNDYVGQQLKIVLSSSQAQTTFDNLRLTAVPEAPTLIAGALLLLPLSLSAVRILRTNRT